MLWLVLCLDWSVSDYARTIYQAALLQKSDIILRAEFGPAAAGTLSANRPYACVDPNPFNKYQGSSYYSLYSLISTDRHFVSSNGLNVSE